MAHAPLTLRRWTRAEYDRLVDLGAFDNDAIELIAGHLIVAEPQGAYHATGIGAVDDALRAALPPGFIVRAQLPVALGEDSEPEPDVAVVPGTRADYRRAHPGRPILVIEVSETSLEFDRCDKASLYARGGVPDYWIVNLVDRVVEVHRDPVGDSSAPYGWSYRSVAAFAPPAVVEVLALPATRISVSTLLP
jgi:Uma2 family endonuclease